MNRFTDEYGVMLGAPTRGMSTVSRAVTEPRPDARYSRL